MDHGNGSQSQPDASAILLRRIRKLLSTQTKYQPNLILPIEDNEGEVSLGIRDGSAHILRCLKVWYKLPTDVLFVSINIMDRFLTKLKVQPKHIACISIASFYIACKMICPTQIPESSDLIMISQCECTPRDLARMEAVILDKMKISLEDPSSVPVTSLSFLRLFHEIMCSTKAGEIYKVLVDQRQMYQHLEVIACDGACVNFKASHVAIVLLWSTICRGMSGHKPSSCSPIHIVSGLSLMRLMSKLQEYCRISQEQFDDCFDSALKIIGQYNSQLGMPHRQRLVWRLSQRTLRYLRPTNKLMSTLPTIEEQGLLRNEEE